MVYLAFSLALVVSAAVGPAAGRLAEAGPGHQARASWNIVWRL